MAFSLVNADRSRQVQMNSRRDTVASGMEPQADWEHLPPVPGTVIRRDDIDVGFSPRHPKRGRRYLVVDVRNGRVRVVPLCSEGQGVVVPGGTFANPIVEGVFVRWSTTISFAGALPSQDDEHIDKAILDAVRRQWSQAAGRMSEPGVGGT